jgi:1,4-dihydroxy-2-naphthoate octaprenyltransferase
VTVLKIDAALNQPKNILRLARFHFLAPGFMLYLMGYLLALLGGVEYDLTKFIFGYFVFFSVHISVSFSNDYFDRHSDRNSVKTVFSGKPFLAKNIVVLFSFLFNFCSINPLLRGKKRKTPK